MPVFIVVIAVAVLGGGYFFFSGHKAPVAPVPTPAPITAPAPEPVAPVAGKKKHFDGQYSAEGTYVIPNGETEKITVSLTLKDSVITDVDFASAPLEAGSKFNQGKFRQGFKDLVVGKDIDSVNLTVVNGSSLTPKGFMAALAVIGEKAKTRS